MEYRDTGLPEKNRDIYRAFTIYARMKESVDEENIYTGLRIAMTLNETGCNSTDLFCYALLSDVPDAGWDLIEKRFPASLTDLKKEIDMQKSLLWTAAPMASDDARLFFLALLFATFSHESISGAQLRALVAPVMAVLKKIVGTTSSPALEKKCIRQVDKILREAGDQDMKGSGDDWAAAAGDEGYPSFEKTGLAKYDQIIAAYGIVTGDPRTRPDDLYFALDVARTLCQVPAEVRPDAVAAALLQVCISNIGEKDRKKWGNSVGDRVISILNEGDVYTDFDPKEAEAASEDFKQVIFAHALGVIEDMYLQGCEEKKVNLLQQESMEAMRRRIEQTKKLFFPLLGKTETPALEQALVKSVERLQNLVDDTAEPAAVRNSKARKFPEP